MDVLAQRVTAFEVEYHQNLQALAAESEQAGNVEAAARIRALMPERVRDTLYVPRFPREVQPPLDELEDWEQRFRAIRSEYAQQLYEVVRTATRQGWPTFAFHHAMSVLQADPDFQPIRRMLGQRLHNGQWHTEWEIAQLRRNFVDHPQFGWIPPTHVARMEDGQRLVGTRWMSEEDDIARHGQSVVNGWQIETEHYAVRTNHSIEEAVRIARRLEEFHFAWHLMFFRYVHDEQRLMEILHGRRSLFDHGRQPKHGIVLFKSRSDFGETLSSVLPGLPAELAQKGIGYFSEQTLAAYFFVPDGDPEEQRDARQAVYHEAAHQLFFRHRPPLVARPTGQNAWAKEAMPLYLESFRVEGEYYLFGGPDEIRLISAKRRFLDRNEHVPIASLAQRTQRQLESDPAIQDLYAQFSGMGYFFIHAENGRYRNAFIVFLFHLYAGDDSVERFLSLMQRTGPELDAAYGNYMRSP